MKYIKIIALGLCFLSIFSCDEKSATIPCLSCDGTTTVIEPTAKKILVEEFTGVRCVNCPAGSAEIENLLSIHGEALIPVSIHTGFFSTPYTESTIDFRTEIGTALENFLGTPSGYPTSVINRTLFANEDGLQVFSPTWGGYIQQERQETSPLVLNLSLSFDEASRRLTANTKIEVAETVSDETRFSVMVLEDGIVDYQDTQDGLQADYTHKHVLRDMMTPFNGEAVMETLSQGETITKEHSMTLPADWNVDKISVVVFVSKSGDTKEVIQVESEHL